MTAKSDRPPLRVLFVCTGNSARSQMAEAVLNAKGKGRYEAFSAGSHPAAAVHPFAIETLRDAGLAGGGRAPRGLDGLDREHWDIVVTVCDNARESCPLFPGQPVVEHWGLPDPAALEGTEQERRAAFRRSFAEITQRIDRLIDAETPR